MRLKFVTSLICALWLGLPALAAPVTGVVRVVDGDTLDVGETRVRIHGIDAPEVDQTCERPDGSRWDCGAWVRSEVTQRYEGRRASCEPVEQDRYGRTVARCVVAGQDIGQALVRDGLAFAYRRYTMDYDLDEKGAAINDRGLHASKVQAPAAFRRSKASPAQTAQGGCAIKGNISGTGRRIFHSPGQRDYAKTRINTTKGERWFCSAAEARAAGWRAAKR